MAYNKQRHTVIKRAISLTSPRRIKGREGHLNNRQNKRTQLECFNETGSVSCVGAVNARTRVPPFNPLLYGYNNNGKPFLGANIRTKSIAVKL
jgi:hypothetical protein